MCISLHVLVLVQYTPQIVVGLCQEDLPWLDLPLKLWNQSKFVKSSACGTLRFKSRHPHPGYPLEVLRNFVHCNFFLTNVSAQFTAEVFF